MKDNFSLWFCDKVLKAFFLNIKMQESSQRVKHTGTIFNYFIFSCNF